MLSIFGFDKTYTFQERVTRMSLGLSLFIMTVMPLPFCIWNPLGWLAYVVYLFPILIGLYPLVTQGYEGKYYFHWIVDISIVVITCSIDSTPFQAFPFLFIFFTLYLMYWQLEKRLYTIRKSFQEYKYEVMPHGISMALVKQLFFSTLKKSLLPALAGTLFCAIGLLGAMAALIILITAFVTICIVIQSNMERFKLESGK